jgi:N-acyl-D-aspartate/D-glutamate deacylase
MKRNSVRRTDRTAARPCGTDRSARAAAARSARGAIATALLLAIPVSLSAQQSFDLLIRNGRLLDGTGNPWYSADVGIRGDRIAAVGALGDARAGTVIDATGLYVAPGFIDVHTHAGRGLVRPELAGAEPLLLQGITTAVLNPDGGGPVDLDQQRRALEEHGIGVNAAQLIGHGSVRREVLGMTDRAPTDAELTRMQDLARTGMEAGAFGLSSGPYYAPGSYSSTEELVALARIAAEYGGVYTSHIRDEADYTVGVVAAVDEVIRVAREAHLPAVATHLKALGPRVWGFGPALAKRIERSRGEGLEVYADQYPYTASATGLGSALLPRWAQAGGRDSLLARLRDAGWRAQVRAEMVENLARRGGAARIQFRYHDADPSIEGRRLSQVAAERQLDPVDAAIEIIRAGGAGVVSFNMDDGDVEHLMRQPWMMTSSDGDLVEMDRGVPHPRVYGAFPRKIRMYVLDEEVITLADAIRSMTSLPATVFSIPDRGLVQEGMVADLVVFDLETITDRATYSDPHQLSEGMVYVLVNGTAAIADGRSTGARAGLVLRR